MWAEEAGLTVNAPTDDQVGWDLIVNWPFDDPLPDIPLDKQAKPPQCKIQVKASTSPNPRWKVKLTNWVRFVDDPGPCFFVLLQFNRLRKCVAASIVHVDEVWIKRVLGRLRSLDPNAKLALHKHYITLTMRSGVPLPSLSGTALEQSLHAFMAEGLGSYARKKIEAAYRAGYEDGGATLRITFNIPSDANIEDVLVDFALGLTPELELESGEVRDTRFGIPAPAPDHILPRGSKIGLAKREPHAHGKVILRRIPVGIPLVLGGDVYVPSAVSHLVSKHSLKIRFALPFMDISWSPFGSRAFKITPHFPAPDTRHRLSEFVETARLFSLLHEAGSQDSDISIMLLVNEERIASGIISGLDPLPAPLQEWSSFVLAAMRLAEVTGVADQVETSILELARQYGRLQFVSGVLDGRAFRLSTYLEETPTSPESPWWLPAAVEITMGDFVFQISCAMRLILTDIRDEGGQQRYMFDSNGSEVLDTYVFISDETRPSVKELQNDVANRFDNDQVNVISGLLEWL